jgi:hypothetical protein
MNSYLTDRSAHMVKCSDISCRKADGCMPNGTNSGKFMTQSAIATTYHSTSSGASQMTAHP